LNKSTEKYISRSKDYLADNMGLVVLLMESRYKEPLRLVNLGKDKIKFHFLYSGLELKTPLDEIVQEVKDVKPRLTELLERLYGHKISSVKLYQGEIQDGIELVDTNLLTRTTVKKDELQQYVRETCKYRIQTECILRNIPNSGLELIDDLSLEETMDTLDTFNRGIEIYCPNGKKPDRPVSFNMYIDGGIKAEFVELSEDDIRSDPILNRRYRRFLKRDSDIFKRL